jgi:hypothetical protein
MAALVGKWLESGPCAALADKYSLYGWMIAWRYSHRPKADTVGYAELHDSSDGGTVRLVLRPDWRVHYRGETEPNHTKRISKTRTASCCFTSTLAAWPSQPRSEAYARQTVEQWQGLEDWQKKAGTFNCGSRKSKGDIGGEKLALRDGKQYGSNIFDHQSVVRNRYIVPWGADLRIFEFDMPVDQANEVEPIAWRSVSEMLDTADSVRHRN